MLDSVLLWLNCGDSEKAISSLSNTREITNRDTGEMHIEGNLKNLRVRVKANGLSVNGSLPRFLYGLNCERFTRQATEQAIEELSDLLNLPIEQAKVYRLEAGANMLMRQSVSHYLRLLGAHSRYKRREMESGLLYKNSIRCLSLYDKITDLKRHKEPIPEIIAGRNLLRYELKLNSRVADDLGKNEILAKTLYEEGFYIRLIDRWKEEYFSIRKVRRLMLKNAEAMKGPKELERYLAAVGLRAIGEEVVLAMVEEGKESRSKIQRSRLKSRIRELAAAKNFSESEEGILELDEKVRQAAQFYR